MLGLSALAVVPARGGSKGVPRKNLRPLRGRSLVARAVEVGLATCSAVVVSSDDPRINREAVEAGAGFVVRPADLATDEAPMLPVVQHVETLDDPQAPSFDTLGGFIAHAMGRVPRRGERFEAAGLVFAVLHTRGGAVRWFKVTPQPPADAGITAPKDG